MFKPSENNFGLPKSLIDSVAAVLAEKAPPFGKKDDKSDSGGDKKPAFGKKKSDDGDEDDDEEMIGKDGKKTKVDLKPKLSIKENARVLSIIEAAKWRQGYSASGHPAGYKHKNGEIGPIGGTFKMEPHYDDENKVPVNKYRDYSDPLAKRAATKTSTLGKPLLKKNAENNLKNAIKNAKGKHGPVNKLPEEVGFSGDEIARIEAIMAESKQFDKGDEPADHKYDSTNDKGPEHIIMQLRKAKSLGSANKHIEFNNGKKVKVDAAHVHKALDMHASFKRAPEKDEFTKQIAKSHDHLVRAVTNK